MVFCGLFLVGINLLWIGLIVATACARFRDVSQVVITFLQVAFFITPIFWPPERLADSPVAYSILVDLNYVYHLVDVIRAPLLGKMPSLLTYQMLILGCCIGFLAVGIIFGMFRKRIVYWV